MQRANLRPDVISYALLIKAYGKGRREDEALAVFEEMLDARVRYVGTIFFSLVIEGVLLFGRAHCTIDESNLVGGAP